MYEFSVSPILGPLRFCLNQSWLDGTIMGCTRASSSQSSAQTLTCGTAYLETSCCQVSCFVLKSYSLKMHSSCAAPCFDFVNFMIFAEQFVFYLLMKAGTPCFPACPRGSRLKSRACSQLTWRKAFASPALQTETSQYGAEEQCWPTCPHSAVHGSVRKNMKRMGRRLSSENASEMDYCEVWSPDPCVTALKSFTKCNRHSSRCHVSAIDFVSPFKYLFIVLSQFSLISVNLYLHQQISDDLLLALGLNALRSTNMARMKFLSCHCP